MTKMIGYKRVVSVLGGTLLAVALLMQIPANVVAAKPTDESVKVLQRAQLGTYIEDVEFIPNGPYAGHIAFMSGYEVHGVPAEAGADRAVHKLFDIRRLGMAFAPKGIVYIEAEQLFGFVELTFPASGPRMTLFVCDHQGNPLPPRTMEYADGYVPDFVPDSFEGLAYLPETSSLFPDHLVAVVLGPTLDFSSFTSRLQVIRRNGQVVAQIPVPDAVASNLIFGVTFMPPDRLLVSTLANEIWTLDFAGNIVSGPVLTELLPEGLAELKDGRIATGQGPHLRLLDAAFNRLPQDDRDASTGAGLVFPRSVSWNSDTDQHLMLAHTEESGGNVSTLQVAAVPLPLDSASRVVDLGAIPFPGRVTAATYLPDEHLIAVAFRRRGSSFPPEIALYDNGGTLVERINIAAVGSPVKITYIPSTREFPMTVLGQLSKLKILTRAGTLAREIDLSLIGINFIEAVAYFNPAHSSGGQFLIFGGPDFFDDLDRAVVTDFNGNLLNEFNYRDALGLLNVRGVSVITTGPQAGAFSAISFEGSEIVVFRLAEDEDEDAEVKSDS